MAERTAETLAHILDAIAQIDRFTAGMTLDNYHANAMAQRAVERCIEIISEASRRGPRPSRRIVVYTVGSARKNEQRVESETST